MLKVFDYAEFMLLDTEDLCSLKLSPYFNRLADFLGGVTFMLVLLVVFRIASASYEGLVITF